MIILTQNCENIKARLACSKFRTGIKLDSKDAMYYQSRGEDAIYMHALDFVRNRLAPAEPKSDGKQTPWRGHPVFSAQHATATCCRRCLERWHAIPRGRKLTEDEIDFVLDLIMDWLREKVGSINK